MGGSSDSWEMDRQHTKNVIVYLLLIVFAIITLAPLAWGVSTSLKTNVDVYGYPPQWIPENPRWSNYTEARELAPFVNFYWNSFYITTLIVIGQLFTSSMAGFAFARLRFPGRDRLFLLYLASLMIPFQVNMITIFLMVKEMGWENSHLSLIVPFLATPFGTFLWPLILIRSPELYTVTQGIGLLRGLSQFATAWELVMAGTLTAMIPIVIVFMLAQRYFIEGITLTGLKGWDSKCQER